MPSDTGTFFDSTKHGHRRTEDGKSSPTYNSWRSMKIRCLNPNRSDFRWYGGRGVQVCPQWLGPDGFDRFLADMGPRPEGTTLDRIDVNGHYEPSNCRWATDKMQRDNRRIHEDDWDWDPDEDGYRVEPKWPELLPELQSAAGGCDANGDEWPF